MTGWMYSINMHALPPIYRCRTCGATSYRKLTHRGADGVMHYSGLYRCSGCELTFAEPSVWRDRRRRPRANEADAIEPRAQGPGTGASAP